MDLITSLSREAIPMQGIDIVGTVLINFFCAAIIPRSGFVGVSQGLATSQPGYKTK